VAHVKGQAARLDDLVSTPSAELREVMGLAEDDELLVRAVTTRQKDSYF
jgi:hypothetical protein